MNRVLYQLSYAAIPFLHCSVDARFAATMLIIGHNRRFVNTNLLFFLKKVIRYFVSPKSREEYCQEVKF